ncbi:DUF2802 domain-containing protein [Idiomarina sp. HP20-50]|uniref:DUF2802 domain-containing protein n=1 Tax=Idiomarina sp. HP20-50 TaxID=3070813 RepID=UPI00294B551C|nr:DUF2802 domain-containing protein [Idiomarina sp. HP20-50]MDV6316938.1 DUF2802 domain-containing protein [Idiomarina sp. HP20-50]
MMTNWLLIISALALGLALIALVTVIITSRRQAELIERQQQRLLMLTETASEVLQLREQFKQSSEPSDKTDFAQQKAVAQLQQHVAQLTEEHKQLQQKLQEVAEQDPGSKLYQRAAKLVVKGASTEELMQECDLPQAEAELLISLHKKGA